MRLETTETRCSVLLIPIQAEERLRSRKPETNAEIAALGFEPGHGTPRRIVRRASSDSGSTQTQCCPPGARQFHEERKIRHLRLSQVPVLEGLQSIGRKLRR